MEWQNENFESRRAVGGRWTHGLQRRYCAALFLVVVTRQTAGKGCSNLLGESPRLMRMPMDIEIG
jgi:hypothetical protein